MRRIALLAGILSVATVGVFSVTAASRRASQHEVAPPADTLWTDSRLLDQDIALFEQRTKEDSWSAADRSRLAALYVQRGREIGAFTDFQRAESVAVSSIALRASRNDESFAILASARLAMHDFTGALTAARQLVRLDPDEPRHRALLGEILLELGQYDEASEIFRPLERDTDRLSVASRLARWYELTGRLTHARNVMRYALRRAMDERGLSAEQQAWFHLRMGELELKAGAVERAESLFVRGLQRFPGDYRLLGALARAAALRADWLTAIRHGERAIAISLDPATLGVMSDAYAALGDWTEAASYAGAMRAAALTQPGPIHRAWAYFLLDHGDDPAAVLRRTRRELVTRRDVYGYDVTAWALHVLGRDNEAWPVMTKALAQGTEDALLWYHAAAIAGARGDDSTATKLAERALALNPRFHPVLAKRAVALARGRLHAAEETRR